MATRKSTNTQVQELDTEEKPKVPSLQILDGELFVFGNQVPRHPKFPWLFSATHVHKFCEPTLRRVAENNGKDPDKFYLAKRPGVWLQKNILSEDNEERVEAFAKFTRKRVQKYGVNLGFGLTAAQDAVNPSELSDLEMIFQSKAGRYEGGTYIAQHVITKYVSTFSPKFEAAVHNIFIAVLSGEVEEVTRQVEENARRAKGSKERQEHKEQNYRLIKACGDKQLLAVHPQKGINLATLGMTAKKYKEKTGATEPLNDNLPVGLVRERAVAVEMTAKAIEDSPSAKISPKEGLKIGFRCGIMAKQVLVDREAQELLFRNGLAKDKRARATAKKYGLV